MAISAIIPVLAQTLASAGGKDLVTGVGAKVGSTAGGKTNILANIQGLFQTPQKKPSTTGTEKKKSGISFEFNAEQTLAAADLLASPDSSKEILASLLSKRATEEAGAILEF